MTDTPAPAGRGGAAVHLQELTRIYPNSPAPAVDGIGLDIAPGEFMTLLGPSGSGKTTVLNMIAGFVGVTAGRIQVDGRDVVDVPAHKRDIGVVFQHYALFPHMTAAQNIAFPLQQRKVDKGEIRARVAAALKLVHLDDFGDRHPRRLSGGQQQRVAFARAVVFNPRLLLMDEPLGALDKRLREELQVEIARIHRELGITFLYVTHDQDEALGLSDRIAVFNNGRIEQVGTPDELYERPRTLFVAEFLGDSTTFQGCISTDRGSLACDGADLRIPRTELPTGTRSALVVRPERLSVLVGNHAPPPGVNALDAVVTEIIYVGSSRKLAVRFDSGTSGLVREQAGAYTASDRGDRVRIGWRVEDGTVIAAEAGSSDAPVDSEPAARPLTASHAYEA